MRKLLLAMIALTMGAPLAHAAALVGGLHVVSDPPGATVFVNGDVRGVTPCGVRDVPVGQTEVELVMQGYVSVKQTAEVAGDAIFRLRLKLEPLAGVGAVSVLVEPAGATVELDRVPAGRTPLVLRNVRAGAHSLRVSRSGLQPMQRTVNVGPGRHVQIEGRLARPGERPTAAAYRALDEDGSPEWDVIPRPGALPEERLLEPLRRLVRQRSYDEAIARLDALAASPAGAEYGRRLGQQRAVIQQVREVVEVAYARFAEMVGQNMALTLRGGIRLDCTVMEVDQEHLTVQTTLGVQRIPLRNVGSRQIARLAALAKGNGQAGVRRSLALLHAAEGDFEAAYEELRADAQASYDVASARSYVDAERLWAAALEKQARLARLQPDTATPASTLSREVTLLLDTYHGTEPPAALRRLAQDLQLKVARLEGPFRPEAIAGAGLLLVVEPGGASRVPPYDRLEVQRIVDFVRSGGSLVYVGTADRTRTPADSPFAPLLRWLGASPLAGKLRMSPEAPDDYPRPLLLCLPTARHPATRGVRRVLFPADTPALGVESGAFVLLRASPFVKDARGKSAPPVAFARSFGAGKVLILSSVPRIDRFAWDESPEHENDGQVFLRQALRWAATPMQEGEI